MKLILTLALLVVGSCGRNKPTAVPINPAALNKAASEMCPTGQVFKLYDHELRISQDPFPDPAIFAVNTGAPGCSLEETYDRSTGPSWLKVSFSETCLRNGTLWTLSNAKVFDSVRVEMEFKKYQDPLSRMMIETNYGHSADNMFKAFGFLVYSCQ